MQIQRAARSNAEVSRSTGGGAASKPAACSRTARRLAFIALVAGAVFTTREAAATTTPANIPNSIRDLVTSDAARDLLVRADEVLNSITYTTYSTSNTWDPDDGVYKLVCVHYLNRLLDEALPEQYDQVRDDLGRSVMSIWDWFDYFYDIPYYSVRGGFKRLQMVTELKPGDVITWRNNVGVSSGAWGHTVIVADMPRRDTRWSNAYEIRVTDSTSTPHSEDNRSGSSGVGAGKMLIRASSNGKAYQIAWTLNGYWKPPGDTSIVMVRPMTIY